MDTCTELRLMQCTRIQGESRGMSKYLIHTNMRRSKKEKRRLKFLKFSKDSKVQHRLVVGDPGYRKKKYMRNPDNQVQTVTYYPDKKRSLP